MNGVTSIRNSGFEVGDTPDIGTFYDFFVYGILIKVTIAELLPQLENTVFAPEQQPYHSLLQNTILMDFWKHFSD